MGDTGERRENGVVDTATREARMIWLRGGIGSDAAFSMWFHLVLVLSGKSLIVSLV